MRKIKYMKQLKQEKKKLENRQEELERKIRGDWQELKIKLRPQSLAKEAAVKWMDKQTEVNNSSDNILTSTLSYGASLLAKKFSVKAGEKLEALFKKKN